MLKFKNVSVSYAGIRALRNVSVEVNEGEIYALVGPNGAGKSSLLNAASGIVPLLEGSIELAGKDIAGKPAHMIARDGLIQVPEGRRIVGTLSVLENLLLGRKASNKGVRGTTDLNEVFELFPVLAERVDQSAGQLSGGQQQMLAIGRALMGRPRVLLLDEPSLGLAPVIIREVYKALVQLNARGLTLLLVEQNVRMALETASRAAVLEQGAVVRQCAAAQLATDTDIADHYLARATVAARPLTRSDSKLMETTQ